MVSPAVPPPPIPLCSNCSFYFPIDDTIGACKRYPPMCTMSARPTQFPILRGDDWCGEYIKK